MTDISLQSLEKIPFLDFSDVQGRFIVSLAFHSDQQWHVWVPAEGHALQIQGEPKEGWYFAREGARSNDIYYHFLDFLAQRATFPGVERALNALRDDFYNLSASLAKFDLLYKMRNEVGIGVRRMVATEIEYVVSVCREIFDLLQEVACRVWQYVKLKDATIRKKDLRDSFRKMVLENDLPMTASQISSKFAVPSALGEFYARHVGFFVMLRRFRDNLVHHGSQLDFVYSTERGFAIHESTRPFSDFSVWSEDHKLPNGLCSLRPAIGYLIEETISTCEDFSRTLEKVVQFPRPIVPGFKLFMRGPFTSCLALNSEAVRGCKWWDIE